MNNKWISIENDLPNVDEEGQSNWFICANNTRVYMAPCNYNSNSKTWYMYGDYLLRTTNVTHWMPLPDPPTPEQENLNITDVNNFISKCGVLLVLLDEVYPHLDDSEKDTIINQLRLTAEQMKSAAEKLKIAPINEVKEAEENELTQAINLLKEYEQWEADLIGDNEMWWPYADKDAISGKTYDKMLELQAKRNELLKP